MTDINTAITAIINAQSDYKLHVALKQVLATGEANLLIESTWAAAKIPDERQTVLNLTLSPDEMTKLGYVIVNGARA